jgi:pimeloyl-ACP methyl ester carboxylesterase
VAIAIEKVNRETCSSWADFEMTSNFYWFHVSNIFSSYFKSETESSHKSIQDTLSPSILRMYKAYTPPHRLARIFLSSGMDPTLSLPEQGVRAIISPPRKQYRVDSLPFFFLGPSNRPYTRHSVTYINARRQRIVGSIYVCSSADIMNGGPCVIYLHGNCSSQHEGQFLIPNVCPRGIALFCFDFPGCGLSGGDYISLGHYEATDVAFLVDSLHASFGLGPFVLWGRSMGAATALLLQHPLVIGKIVDSAFTSLPEIVKAIAKRTQIAPILLPGALLYLRIAVRNRAHFDMATVAPIEAVRLAGQVPVRFCHAENDDFVPVEHALELYAAYASADKDLDITDSGHNGQRSLRWIEKGCKFAMELFGIDTEYFFAVRFACREDGSDQHFRTGEDMLAFMHGRGLVDEDVQSPVEAAGDCGADVALGEESLSEE